MKTSFLLLLPTVFGIIAGDYVGPQNGFRNGNGNGNAYGVPTDSITPPQPQGGPYPPSGWKPSGRRLLLPGEGRSAQQPIDSGYGQPPPPPQYGPVNPTLSGPSVDNQYGPSIDSTGPPNNQYIPGTGFGSGNGHGNGNGNSNGNVHNGNGNGNGFNGNGNGHNGNGNGHNGNGNGHNGNGNGHNGNGNGLNGNGNGHSGNGFSNGGSGNGNGHSGNGLSNGGNGNGHSGNGFSNGGNGNGNGHNGNGFSNGGNGNGNGHSGNGFSNGGNGNGNGHNGNGNGQNGGNGNGANSLVPAFHGAFPGGLIYPFVQHSVPAVLAFRPGNEAGHGKIYPLYQVSTTPSHSGTGIIASSIPTGNGVFPVAGANPSFQISPGAPDLGGAVYPTFQITGAHDVAGSHPAVVGQGTGLVGHGIGQYYTLLSNPQSQKPNILGLRNGLINPQLQNAVSNAAYAQYGNEGVPLGFF